MADHAAWIGRQETVADVASRDRVAGLMALLDDPAPLPDYLPPLAHWLLARPMVRQSDMGEDGHPKRGGATLLPPIAEPRRMWAASEIDFIAPIPLDAEIQRRTKVVEITPKQGRSGPMTFVTLEHEVLHHGALAIRERQHIVYREAVTRPTLSSEPEAPPATPEATRVMIADPVALFRYSALTFNSHRIHYDRDHAEFEGYPGLVVHGPFAATLLLEHARRQRPGAVVAHFAFRASAPLLADSPFTLAMADGLLWITNADGATAMTADIRWA